MRKVTSEDGTELGMDEAREGGEAVSERTRDDWSNGARERIKGGGLERGGMEIGRDGNFKGGNLRRTLDNTAVSAQNNTQRGPCHRSFHGDVIRRVTWSPGILGWQKICGWRASRVFCRDSFPVCLHFTHKQDHDYVLYWCGVH